VDISSVAAIILNYNGFDDTVDCVKSLRNYYDDELKIYLIDNASPDGSGKRLERYFPEIEVFRLDTNRGYAAGNNFGISRAYRKDFEYFLVLNQDIVVNSDILDVMLREFSEDDRLGIVTCKVLYKQRPRVINYAGGRINKLICGGQIYRLGQRDTGIVEKKLITFVSGMIFLMKREVLDDVGYMNESFFMYAEDVEYSMRVGKRFKMLYTSEVSVLHKCGGGLAGRSYSPLYLYYKTRNILWLARMLSPMYFIYAVIFSFFNCIFKSAIILIEPMRASSSMGTLFHNLAGLWRGFSSGLFSEIGK